MQTRTFGTPSTVIWQFGQWPEQHGRPRGRWYLKEREKTRLPAANAAEAIVSPSKPVTFQPANVNETALRDRFARRREAEPHEAPEGAVEGACWPSTPGAPAAPDSGARIGTRDLEDLVRTRIAPREEPLPAPAAVLPPLALHAGDVVAEVHVIGQLTQRRRAERRPARDLAEVRVLVDGAGSTDGTREKEGHQGLNCTISNAVPNSATNLHRCRALVNNPPNWRCRASDHDARHLAEGGELGTNEIARRTGMTPSTVSRQLGTLAASGLVERVDATGQYRLGIRLVHLANAVLARLDVREVARPHLVALVDATGETATLSVPGDEDAITVDFVPGSHQVQPVSRLGRPSIAHATSAGKVMLAFSGASFRTARSARSRPARSRIAKHWPPRSRPCERGYARAAGRREPGLTAIAAPIRSARGELEAIVALQGRVRASMRTAVDTALPLLLERATRLARARLGLRIPRSPERRPQLLRTLAALGGGASRSASARMLARSSSGLGREAAAEAGEDARGPVERTDTDPAQASRILLDQLGERRGNTPRGFLEREVEQHLHLPAPRRACERRRDVGDGVEAGRRRDGRLRGQAGRRIRST